MGVLFNPPLGGSIWGLRAEFITLHVSCAQAFYFKIFFIVFKELKASAGKGFRGAILSN